MNRWCDSTTAPNFKMIKKLYIFIVKWLLIKPITKLSYILNGRIIGKPKWYEKKQFVSPVPYPRVLQAAYKLSKYAMFFK